MKIRLIVFLAFLSLRSMHTTGAERVESCTKYRPAGIFRPHYPHTPDARAVKQSTLPLISAHSLEYGEAVADLILDRFFSKGCPKCHRKMEKRVSNRPAAIRCACGYMGSRFSRTPFDRLRIPYGILGLLIEESAVMHPHVLTATMIQRKYGVAYNTATLLKRRVQLLASELQDTIRHLIRKDLAHRFKGLNLPRHSSEADLTSYREKHRIPQADTLVLYSASQRANKGRKRYRHSGQTASIYKSDKLGGEQIGTLTHILSWKKGPIDIHSIPDLKMEQIAPILDDVLPAHTPLFTDEGYKFYFRKNRNHRMVNHSARSKDARHKWARNRFCKNGIHNQVAEGNGRALKQAFSTYGWISPKYSTLYLNEYSFFRNLRYFGLDTIASAHLSRTSASSGTAGAHEGPVAYHQSGSISSSSALKRSYANSCEHTLPAIDGAEAGRMFCVKEDHTLCADAEVKIFSGPLRL